MAAWATPLLQHSDHRRPAELGRLRDADLSQVERRIEIDAAGSPGDHRRGKGEKEARIDQRSGDRH
jgi:putative component of toxin-antitoxin plasmid stabilization module